MYKICVQMHGLEYLGITNESYGPLLIPMSKMPSDIRLQISRSMKKEVWEINELLKLIRNEIKARETSKHVKVYTEKVKQVGNYSNKYGKQVNQAASATLITWPQETMNKGTTSIRCVYCGNDHFFASCENIKNVMERKNILLHDRCCLLCLKVGHYSQGLQNNKKMLEVWPRPSSVHMQEGTTNHKER